MTAQPQLATHHCYPPETKFSRVALVLVKQRFSVRKQAD